MAAPKWATTRPERRIVAPAGKRTQIRLTVDTKFTKTHFIQLFAALKIRNKNDLAEHIIMNFKTKAARRRLSRSIAARGWTFGFKASTPPSYFL
jgi:hypothetical protein